MTKIINAFINFFVNVANVNHIYDFRGVCMHSSLRKLRTKSIRSDKNVVLGSSGGTRSNGLAGRSTALAPPCLALRTALLR